MNSPVPYGPGRMSLVAALLALAMLVGILRLLAPKSSARVRGFRPTADRGVDRPIKAQTERRGAILAALAAANIASVVVQPEAYGGLILSGIVAALLFRFTPEAGSLILGSVGVITALVSAVGETCAGVEGDRRVLAFALVVFGPGLFAVLRLLFTGAGIAHGGPVTLLNLFGIIQLGAFVAAPFGLALTDLAGLGDSLTAVVTSYGLIVASAALLPDFTVSIIGAALLAATMSVDTVVGDVCTARQGVVLAVVAGFVTVWWVVGRLARA